MAGDRGRVLRDVAARIPASSGDDCVLVGIDGVDGAGKTTFADELADVVRASGRTVVRILLDDFHQMREVRYARGRHDPEGYWLDSFNYERFRSDVLEPLGRGGSRRFRRAAHDLIADEMLNPGTEVAAPGSVVIVDGLFLHRDELVGTWDFSVFLEVPREVATRRLAERDGSHPDPDHPSGRRYREGQQIYLDACSPRDRATLVIDNSQ